MRVSINPDYLTDIANAIRAKAKTTQTYTPSQMAAAISEMSTNKFDLEIESYSSIEELPISSGTKIAIQSNTPVGEVFIQQTTPENGVSGDIYIFNGNPTFLTEYDYSVRPFSEINLVIYPQQIQQYENGEWVDKSFKVLKNGVWKTPVNPQEENKWRWDKYIAVTGNTTSPTLDKFENKSILLTNFYKDSAVQRNMGIADSYSAIASCYVFVENDYMYTGTVETDDAGSVNVNGTLITTCASCVATTTQFTLKKGWNKIQVCYTEGSGGDGWVLTPKLSTVAQISKMYAMV